MGTVGLAFGSPTSGAGFNVSSTVAEIVSNLQNVETPWNNQLTALESQDTVISNLGTLFSNVSTDMSALTDATGILAEKEGSSSDTNVLELTAATSAATAGTHTVVVNSLAQTSSGYMAEIANSSDTLSGSITLQVGSGATANHHPRFLRQHSRRSGLGDQRLGRGHHRQCAHRRHRLASEPGLRHLGRRWQHHRHRQLDHGRQRFQHPQRHGHGRQSAAPPRARSSRRSSAPARRSTAPVRSPLPWAAALRSKSI